MLDGEFQRRLSRLGHRYAVLGKAAFVLVAAGFGLPVAPVPGALLAGVAGIVLLNAILLRWPRARWPSAVEVLVAALACLTQQWTVPVEALTNGHSWALVFASFVAVAFQWTSRPVAGMAVAVVLSAAHVIGAAVLGPAAVTSALPLAVWICVEAALSRLLWSLVNRSAAQADHAAARAEQERTESVVAQAVRADERQEAALLHDTAATTLLMVALNQVGRDDEWLRPQLRADLDAIGEQPPDADGVVELGDVLCQAGSASRLHVEFHVDPGLAVSAALGVTFAHCVREALTNVSRHSGAPSATVLAHRRGTAVTVEVIDHGRGFDPAAVPASRRGITSSIIGRMRDADGQASVTSHPGHGSVVRLVHDRG
ncbi:sensor histidine kinase [Saccharothrix sp. NRRL B-16348]|uniref:sensor histidine kinase n=1 Tax=Saccharothrix sp. NRRL B-16348 TaxID=1415542 RepID=UPI0006AEE505|nr:ATP-binding protein [Saccharothrix sp. NRRL B-16348]